MVSKLVDSILEANFTESNRLFEEEIGSIVEQRLLEFKQSISLVELQGYRGYGAKSGPLVGKTDSEKKAVWKNRISQRKAERDHAKHIGDAGLGGRILAKGIEKRRKEGYLGANDAINAKAFIDKVAEYHENERDGKPTYVGWGMNKRKLGEGAGGFLDASNDRLKASLRPKPRKPTEPNVPLTRAQKALAAKKEPETEKPLEYDHDKADAAKKRRQGGWRAAASREKGLIKKAWNTYRSNADDKNASPDMRKSAANQRSHALHNIGRVAKSTPLGQAATGVGRGFKLFRGDSDVKPKGILGHAVRLAGRTMAAASNNEETIIHEAKKLRIRKKRLHSMLVTRKGDRAATRGGGVRRIDKDKYNPDIHNLAVEE